MRYESEMRREGGRCQSCIHSSNASGMAVPFGTTATPVTFDAFHAREKERAGGLIVVMA